MANKSQTGTGVKDRSISSLSGSSQLLMGQNLTRGALQIMNVGNANIAVAFADLTEDNTNGSATAALNTAGSYNIVPNGSYEPDGGFIPMGAIYVIGTAGQPVSAFETA